MPSARDGNGKGDSCVALGLISDCSTEARQGLRSESCELEKRRGDSAATFHVTGSNEVMCNAHPFNDGVRYGKAALIDVECVGTVSSIFPSETADAILGALGCCLSNMSKNLFVLFSCCSPE